MPRPESPDSHDPFQAFLHRVTRPIQFACRDAYAHLPTVRNLDRFVSEQVINTLGERVYPRAMEMDLLSLRNLFVDFHTRLTRIEQQDRLTKALALLSRLQGDARAVSQPAGPSKENQVHPPPVRSSPARPLWELSIQYAKGVGPKRTLLLERLGAHTVEQALWTLPWRYEDRSVITPVAELVPGASRSVCGVITRTEATRARVRRLSILDVAVQDATGTVHAVFFNQPYLEDVLKEGLRVMMTGRVAAGRGGWTEVRLEATQFEVLGAARMSYSMWGASLRSTMRPRGGHRARCGS
jgi:ATP-dependent DNA helicase RecG